MFRKKRPYGLYNRYKLHEKGLDKYVEEFDAEYYAKSLRHLKVLIATILDDSERFMTVYQHCNALTLVGSDTESDSENEAVKDMPSYLSKTNKSLKHRANINEFLQGYFKENHTAKDIKMIKGAFTSKKVKNDELEHLHHEIENPSDDIYNEFENNKEETEDHFKEQDFRETGNKFDVFPDINRNKIVPIDKLMTIKDD